MADRLEIVTLGGLAIRRNGRLLTGFVSRKAEALLVYLACTGREHARESLADLLWDEPSGSQSSGAPHLSSGDSTRRPPAATRSLARRSLWSTHDRAGRDRPTQRRAGTVRDV